MRFALIVAVVWLLGCVTPVGPKTADELREDLRSEDETSARGTDLEENEVRVLYRETIIWDSR